MKWQEATSRKVDFPEATPDSVDIMLRHLYGQSKVKASSLI